MPKDDTPVHGTPVPRAPRMANPPPPLRPVTDSMQPPAGEVEPRATTIASDIRQLKRRITVRKIAGWLALMTALVGGIGGAVAWVNSFAKAARVEKIEAAQLEAQRQVDAITGKEAEHMALHQQSAAEVRELHDDIREIRDLQRAALTQAVYTGRATHARTVTVPPPRDAHPPE